MSCCFAYFLSPDNTFSVHVKMDEGQLIVNYYKSWLKGDDKSQEYLEEWISKFSTCTKVTHSKQVKTKQKYKRCGKVFISKSLIANIVGDRYCTDIPYVCKGSISVSANTRKKILEIRLKLSPIDVQSLQQSLQSHNAFSDNPDYETLNKSIQFFSLNTLSSKRDYKIVKKITTVDK